MRRFFIPCSLGILVLLSGACASSHKSGHTPSAAPQDAEKIAADEAKAKKEAWDKKVADDAGRLRKHLDAQMGKEPLNPVLKPQEQGSQNDQNGAKAMADDAEVDPIPDSDAAVSALQKKVESLEKQIQQKDEALKAAQLKINALAPENENLENPESTLVRSHPSHQTGSEALPAPKRDRDGFINDDSIQLYRNARILFEAGRRMESAIEFKKFVKTFADHPLAGSAQYLVGEAYFQDGKFTEANQEFNHLLLAYKDSSYTPETLHRLAQTSQSLNNLSEAASYRQLLLSLFPQSPAAQLALNTATLRDKNSGPDRTADSTPAAAQTGNEFESEDEVNTAPLTAPLPEGVEEGDLEP